LNFRLLTRYAADFLGAVSNKIKPVKIFADVVLDILDVPLRHPVSVEAVGKFGKCK